MRNVPNFKVEKYRISGPPRSNNGGFLLPWQNHFILRVIASDDGGWDHVSVSVAGRCPTWQEMCFVKELFFRDDEVAMQLHPAKIDWISFHPTCLHLWRPQTQEEIARVQAEWKEAGEDMPPFDWPLSGPIPLPPKVMVAPTRESLGVIENMV